MKIINSMLILTSFFLSSCGVLDLDYPARKKRRKSPTRKITIHRPQKIVPTRRARKRPKPKYTKRTNKKSYWKWKLGPLRPSTIQKMRRQKSQDLKFSPSDPIDNEISQNLTYFCMKNRNLPGLQDRSKCDAYTKNVFSDCFGKVKRRNRKLVRCIKVALRLK